ncbi:hypothetical protein CLV62_12471 [Dysgonomonas alginatilytica]|uniref:Lipoprotein n=1 Tax=Dysgonomonas alginatilytica TaxID=1605892 RepID=A0A2V3PSI7_9BACT|nr:hypothetical protein [Dysgonomonas alginatilytica]PXV61916.1 hypothetical protein CLV62_12471 [Dysgonomonas alginatilytica]
MKKLMLLLLCGLFFFLTYSCRTTIGDNRIVGTPYASEKIKKVHILIKLDQNKGYSEKFGQYIQKQLEAENIESIISYIDDMDLNSNDKIKQEADSFKPLYILRLNIADTDIYEMKQGGNILTMTWDLNISSAQNGKKIWDGGIIMSVGIKGKYQTKKAAQELFKQLKNDGII